MKHLVVLDYSDGIVYFHTINNNDYVNDDYIEELGYNLDECSWMVGENIEIKYV